MDRRPLDGVLLTHAHIGHYLGLAFFGFDHFAAKYFWPDQPWLWPMPLAFLGLMACEEQGPLEKAGEEADNAIQEAQDNLDDATDEAQTLLSDIQDQLVRLSEDVHDLSRQLHPSILDDLGLVEALRSECAGFGKRHSITIDYSATGVPANISGNIRLVIYRVAQEGLRNIAKHAGVQKAWVSLAIVGLQLQLLVFDLGAGFDLEKARLQTGLGLSSIEERIRLISGELAIESAPGHGTTVDVRVPWPESRA